jgi:vacuolar-type H+-ATPase subunit F/Vma7
MYYLIPWPDSQYYDDYDESDGVFSSMDEDGTPIIFVDEDLQKKIEDAERNSNDHQASDR